MVNTKVTNLLDETQFLTEDFLDIYHMRWVVEGFYAIKSVLILKIFLVKQPNQSIITTVIQQVCNFTPKVQATIRHNYQDVAKSILDLGFKYSAGNEIAIVWFIFIRNGRSF